MLWKRRVVDSTDLQFNQWGTSVNEYQPLHLLSPNPSLSCLAYLIFYSINIFIFPALSPHLQVYICLHVARLWSHTSSPLKLHTCCKYATWKLQRCTTMQPADQLLRLTGREKKGRGCPGYLDIDNVQVEWFYPASRKETVNRRERLKKSMSTWIHLFFRLEAIYYAHLITLCEPIKICLAHVQWDSLKPANPDEE